MIRANLMNLPMPLTGTAAPVIYDSVKGGQFIFRYKIANTTDVVMFPLRSKDESIASTGLWAFIDVGWLAEHLSLRANCIRLHVNNITTQV